MSECVKIWSPLLSSPLAVSFFPSSLFPFFFESTRLTSCQKLFLLTGNVVIRSNWPQNNSDLFDLCSDNLEEPVDADEDEDLDDAREAQDESKVGRWILGSILAVSSILWLLWRSAPVQGSQVRSTQVAGTETCRWVDAQLQPRGEPVSDWGDRHCWPSTGRLLLLRCFCC